MVVSRCCREYVTVYNGSEGVSYYVCISCGKACDTFFPSDEIKKRTPDMPKFSEQSFSRLSTCHPDLQALFYEVIKHFDCIILEGFRNEEDQEAAVKAGNSKLHWPYGKHNQRPSLAVDVSPYEPKINVDWKDIKRLYYFGGYVLGIAEMLKSQGKITHAIRYGGDWNMNTQVKDEKFKDLVHFELVV